MMRGSHGPIRQLQDLNWGAFDHASHAPLLRSCNYNLYLSVLHVPKSSDFVLIISENKSFLISI